jgi:hypothetical protein
MKAIYDYILARLSEKSTWVAIITTLASVVGVSIAPEMQDSIVAVGLAVTTLALTIIKDKK